MDFEEQRHTGARLRAELERAKVLYEDAKRAFADERELRDALGPLHPDGTLYHATRVLTETQINYMKALMAYSRFTLDGKLPGPPFGK